MRDADFRVLVLVVLVAIAGMVGYNIIQNQDVFTNEAAAAWCRESATNRFLVEMAMDNGESERDACLRLYSEYR